MLDTEPDMQRRFTQENPVQSTNPRAITIRPGETLPLAIDFARYLADNETVNGHGAPTAALVDLDDSTPTAGMLVGPPSINGTRVQQTVAGLCAGRRYRLEVVIRPTASHVWAAGLEIEVQP